MSEEQVIEVEEPEEAEGLKKHRSPNYPFIGLQAALVMASQLQDRAGTHPVRVTTAWDAWRYKKGAGNQVIAALDAYGLVDVEGIADRRMVKLTIDARKILADHPDTPMLLKQAALKPALHKEIWEYFHGDLPPDSKVIRDYLEFERNFNPRYVNKFIEQFRNTLLFANVLKSDKLDAAEQINIDNGDEVIDVADGGEKIRQTMTLPPGRIFRATIEVYANGTLDIIFAGSMNDLTVPLLNDIFQLKERYEPKAEPANRTQRLESGNETGRQESANSHE